MSYPAINAADLGDIPVSISSVPQQVAIADYLDRETAHIDALIAAKEQLLALLNEKRRALIAQAVTRGLDPRGPLHDSGVAWLGKVPGHWKVLHLKRVLSALDYGISEPVNAVGRVAVIRMGDVQEGEIDYSQVGFLDDVDSSLLLHAGDLVFNRTNSLDQIGKVAIFRGGIGCPVSFASYLVRLRCKPTVIPDYLDKFLNSSYAVAWARSEALPAIGQVNLNPNRYAYLPICLPPVPEQRAIVAFVAAATAKLDALRSAAERSVALLRERRSALIAAAVTGQIEVV